MIEQLITQNEGKTLEFKENTNSLSSIIKSVIALANTSGGKIVIGIVDKTKQIVGVENSLQEEERLANAIADAVEPLLIPDIQIVSFRKKELLIIQVPHLVGPFHLKSKSIERSTYVRLGSTNRVADSETVLSLQMLAKNISYDELPCVSATLETLDAELIADSLLPSLGHITKKQYESLGLSTRKNSIPYPTNAAVLLFSQDRLQWFPDSQISCVCFADETHEEIIDQQVINSPLINAHEDVLAFIRRNTRQGAKIREAVREDIPQYPPQAVREALINAIVHADYTMQGSLIQVAIFSDRIEITNPGALPYGQTMELALSGISRMRNRVMGRIMREIKLIERLGTGLKRIMSIYEKAGLKAPLIEELDNFFRVTLFSTPKLEVALSPWEELLIKKLEEHQQMSTSEIAELWDVTTRTARTRLKKMLDMGLVNRIATSDKDPLAVFKLS